MFLDLEIRKFIRFNLFSSTLDSLLRFLPLPFVRVIWCGGVGYEKPDRQGDGRWETGYAVMAHLLFRKCIALRRLYCHAQLSFTPLAKMLKSSHPS